MANQKLIFVVDDDPFVLRGLGRLLRSAGFEVDTYASGAAFLNDAGDDEPDCVVLDLHMPQTTGFEVQAQLVKRGRSTPLDPALDPDSNKLITSRILMDACIPYEWKQKPVEARMDEEMLARIKGRWTEYGID